MVGKVEKTNIAFIIPCYNPKISDLRECLDSISSQLSSDDEIIVIDDGSNNARKNEKLAKRYKQVKYVNVKSNQGVSNARNIGIERARTKWLTFVDSDDIVLPNTLKNVKEQIENMQEADVIAYSVAIQKKKRNVTFPLLSEKDTIASLRQKVISTICDNPKTIGIAVGKIYKRNFLINHNLRFDVNISRAEDNLFFLDVLSCQPVLRSSPIVFYHIKENLDSTTHKYTKNIWKIFSKTLAAFKERIKTEENKALLTRRGRYVLISIMNEFSTMNTITFKEKKDFCKKLLASEENIMGLKVFRNSRKTLAERLILNSLIRRRLNFVGIIFTIKGRINV